MHLIYVSGVSWVVGQVVLIYGRVVGKNGMRKVEAVDANSGHDN